MIFNWTMFWIILILAVAAVVLKIYKNRDSDPKDIVIDVILFLLGIVISIASGFLVRDESANLPNSPSVSYGSSAAIATREPVYPSDTEEYVLPDSSIRRLTGKELEGLTAYELRLARNEIYARHGRVFDDDLLQKHFDAKLWYKTIPKLAKGEEPRLSSIEDDNVELIRDYEE